jgi:hypothetical protein
MWERIYNALATLLTISVKVERHEKEVDRLNADLREMAGTLRELLVMLRNVSTERESERREIALYIENQMLKFERRLPSAKDEKTDEI